VSTLLHCHTIFKLTVLPSDIHLLLLEMGKIYKIYFYEMFPIANLEKIKQPISIKKIFIIEII